MDATGPPSFEESVSACSSYSSSNEKVVLSWGQTSSMAVAAQTAAFRTISESHTSESSSQAGHSRTNRSRTASGSPPVYAFVPRLMNTMALLPWPLSKDPPNDAAAISPKYTISVHMNCFAPMNSITSLFRGSGDKAEQFVGRFEMGLAWGRKATVSKGGKRRAIDGIMGRPTVKPGQGKLRDWLLDDGSRLSWSCDRIPYVCRHQGMIIAKFIPDDVTDHTPSFNTPYALLEATNLNEAEALMDDVMLSLLVLERQRCSPSGIGVKYP